MLTCRGKRVSRLRSHPELGFDFCTPFPMLRPFYLINSWNGRYEKHTVGEGVSQNWLEMNTRFAQGSRLSRLWPGTGFAVTCDLCFLAGRCRAVLEPLPDHVSLPYSLALSLWSFQSKCCCSGFLFLSPDGFRRRKQFFPWGVLSWWGKSHFSPRSNPQGHC